MTDVKPKHYIVGIILFTLFIVGGVSMLSIYSDTDPTFTDDPQFTKFNKTFWKLEEVNNRVEGIESSITDTDPDQGTFGFLNSLISSAWNAMKTIFTSFSFMGDVLNGLSTIFGIPAWIPSLLFSLVTIMFAFAIYVLIFGRE